MKCNMLEYMIGHSHVIFSVLHEWYRVLHISITGSHVTCTIHTDKSMKYNTLEYMIGHGHVICTVLHEWYSVLHISITDSHVTCTIHTDKSMKYNMLEYMIGHSHVICTVLHERSRLHHISKTDCHITCTICNYRYRILDISVAENRRKFKWNFLDLSCMTHTLGNLIFFPVYVSRL